MKPAGREGAGRDDSADAFSSCYGPWAVVTGASSGIGEQFARALAARGCNLVVVARRADRLDALATELSTGGGVEVETLALDLAEPGSVSRVVAGCAGKDVGLVVSNAGFGLKGLHHQQSESRLEAMVAVNCLAPALLARAFGPALMERGRGGLIFTGSIEGFVGFPLSAAYAATKAFVLSLGEGLWGELHSQGVDVLVVAPGSTDTEALELQGIDKSTLVGIMSPATVVEGALEQLGKRPVHIAGAMNRALVGAVAALPRRAGVGLVGWGMRRTLERSGWSPVTPERR